MDKIQQCTEIINTYSKYGWRLKRVLLCPETLATAPHISSELFRETEIKEATIDALWFARPSPPDREAWELRLVAATPYAIFEAFEADEAEVDREEVRLEIEARLRDYALEGGDRSSRIV